MTEKSKKPKRRWYQFSLRTLFIVMTLFAIGLSLLTRPIMDYRREQAILKSMGPGNVSVDYLGAGVFGEDLCSMVLGDTIYQRIWALRFNAPPPKDFDPARFAELRYLRILSLVNVPFDDDQLSFLSGLENLEILDLSDTAATDDVLTHLEGVKHLRVINTTGTQVTYEGLERLESQLPNLESSRQRRAVAELGRLGSHAREISSGQNGGIEVSAVELRQVLQDVDFEHLRQLPRLRKLILRSGTTDNSMRRLQVLDSVEEVEIDSHEANGAGLQHLVGFRRLKVLRLRSVQFNEAGLRRLSELKTLEELYLYGTQLTGLDLKHVGQLPQLQKLVIVSPLGYDHCYIYDNDLPTLIAMNRLKELTLTGSRISDVGVERLRKALPNTRVEILREDPKRSGSPPDPLVRLGLPAEGSEAFQAGDYDRMVRVYREAVASPNASWLADLWLGHALQLNDRWADAVVSYKKALAKIEPELPIVAKKARRGMGGIQPSFDDWIKLVDLIGRIERDELNDPESAIETLSEALKYVPEANRPLDTFAAETAKPLKPQSLNPDANKLHREWWRPFRTYRVLAETHERQGNISEALMCWLRIRLAHLACGNSLLSPQENPAHLARLWSRLPLDRPVPPMPIFITPTPERPTIDLGSTGSGSSRLAIWEWNSRLGHAILPPAGKSISVLRVTCTKDGQDTTSEEAKKESIHCWIGNDLYPRNSLPFQVKHEMVEDASAKSSVMVFRPKSPDDAEMIFLEHPSESSSRIVISCEFQPRSINREPIKTAAWKLDESSLSMTGVFRPLLSDSTDYRFAKYQTSSLVRMSNGRLLAAFDTLGIDRKILLSTSLDGIEWEEPYEYPGNSIFPTHTPSLAVDDEGMVWMFYQSKRPDVDRQSSKYRRWKSRSEDGRTWTNATPWRNTNTTTSGKIRKLVLTHVPLRSREMDMRNLRTTFDASGRCHLVFDDFGQSLQYAWSDDMRIWSELQMLSETDKPYSGTHPQLLIDEESNRVALIYKTRRDHCLRRGTWTPEGLRLDEPVELGVHSHVIGDAQLLREGNAVYMQMRANPPLLLRAELDDLFTSP